MTANAAVGDFDLMDPEVLGSPYDFYAALREHAPVHLTPYGFWLISRYDDVLAVVRDPTRFSSQMLGPFAAQPSPEVAEILKDAYPGVPTLLTNDPPSHTRFRNLVNKAFSPKRVAQMEGDILRIADGAGRRLRGRRRRSSWSASSPCPCRSR